MGPVGVYESHLHPCQLLGTESGQLGILVRAYDTQAEWQVTEISKNY